MNRKTWIIGAALLVVLLVGAAFVGGRLLNRQPAAGLPEVVGAAPGQAGQSGQTQGAVKVDTATGIPQTSPDVFGFYVRHGDGSVFISTGEPQITPKKNPDGTMSLDAKGDGPEVEVVVPHTAAVYVDVTGKQLSGPPQSGQRIKQVVEPGKIEEIGKSSMVMVWGDRRGDRIIARTVLYQEPMVFGGPQK